MRPGLIQDPQGRSIALEIWALPKQAFGDFIEQIPAPLTIGSIKLKDGQRVKGFLCESAGTQGALDISHFGGWRAFCQQQEKQ